MIGEFLHLGYFDSIDVEPTEISLGDIKRAQERYAERILEFITDRDHLVLDVGCGMGGLLRMLEQRKFRVVGLTPDLNQVAYLKSTFRCPIIHARLEDYSDLKNQFGTIVAAESLQYLDRAQLLARIRQGLRPGGRWVLIDYLDKIDGGSTRPSWEFVLRSLEEGGFSVIHNEDVTPHILPTVRFLHHLGQRFALPIFDFLTLKLEQREPGISYLLGEILGDFRRVLRLNLSIVDPEKFALAKNYRLVVADLRHN